jgi:hypothetical protein
MMQFEHAARAVVAAILSALVSYGRRREGVLGLVAPPARVVAVALEVRGLT